MNHSRSLSTHPHGSPLARDIAAAPLSTSEVLDALGTHLGADRDGHRAFRLLSMLAVDHPEALRDTIATTERLYPQ
ncbi:hypothetical protein [Prescottella agglutinans]|uniref:Uncharacterized protein n=1 Tax=Prescottella agglutinans TaxID=1644129 RepID=A0ABT6M9S6_9NOCA|nr:hypothetical protein [Prescottella agglutinans]MDH6280990.1 hypothetical protein [Prescottella agglutinans]